MVIAERQKPFLVIISASKWWVRTQGIKPQIVSGDSLELQKLGISVAPGKKVRIGPDGGAAATECGSDGQILYLKKISFPKDISEGMVINSVTKGPKFASELIEIFGNRSVPSFGNDLCFPIWLAFCSPQYFQKREMHSPALIWQEFVPPSEEGDEFTVISRLRTQTGISFFEEVLFQNRGFFPSFDEPSGKYLIKELPNGPSSYLEARYSVSEWGMLGDMFYPKTSSFEIYPVPKGQKAKTSNVAMRCSILVDLCKRSPVDVPVVIPTAIARVTDHRIKTAVGPLTYITTNNAYMPPNGAVAAKVTADYNRREHDIKLQRGTNFGPGYRRVLMFSVMIALPLFVYLFLARSNKSKQKQPKTKDKT